MDLDYVMLSLSLIQNLKNQWLFVLQMCNNRYVGGTDVGWRVI